MHKKASRVLLALAVVMIAGIATHQAYAQTSTSASDNQVVIVIIAALTGSIVAPIILWATKENTPDATGKLPSDPFNARQYVIALVVGIPSVITLMITELTGLAANVNSLQSIAILFLMAFVQALGVDIAKSRTASAISNP